MNKKNSLLLLLAISMTSFVGNMALAAGTNSNQRFDDCEPNIQPSKNMTLNDAFRSNAANQDMSLRAAFRPKLGSVVNVDANPQPADSMSLNDAFRSTVTNQDMSLRAAFRPKLGSVVNVDANPQSADSMSLNDAFRSTVTNDANATQSQDMSLRAAFCPKLDK